MSLLSPKVCPVFIALALLYMAPASAAELSALLRIDTEIYYDSNIVMGSIEEKEAEAMRFSPLLNLRAKGTTWETNLNTMLRFTKLSEDQFDSDDQFVDTRLKKFGEKQAWQLDAELRRDSTRSEVEELGGVVAATRVERSSLRPAWTRVFNEKNSLLVGGNWSDAEYDSARFSDYEQYGFDATWVRQLGERLSLQTGVYNSRFQSDASTESRGTESDTIGLRLTLVREFNEQLSGSLSLGARRVETPFLAPPSFFCLLFGIGCPVPVVLESSGFTTEAGLGYQGETWNGSLSVSRSLNPDALSGQLLESDRISAKYSRQLRPSVFFDFAVEFYSDQSLESFSEFDRDRYFLTPAIRWQFAERWSYTTTVRHRMRETFRNARYSEGEATAIFFKVRYSHPRARW